MYKVFIVEDEPLIRNNLRNMIQKIDDKWNINVVGEASDGELALSMIQDLRPDILVTDIRMPFMDGLDLIKHAKKIMPWLKVLIISGFDEFEYAQRSIQLGVDNYLLKPLKTLEVQETLINIVKSIENEVQQTQLTTKLSEEIILKEVAKDYFFNTLISEQKSTEYAISQGESFNFKIINKCYTVMLCQIEGPNIIDSYKVLNNRLTPLFEETSHVLSTFLNPKMLKLVVTGSSESLLMERAYQVGNIILHDIQNYPDLFSKIAIGKKVSRVSQINDSYYSAVTTLSLSSHIQTNQILNEESFDLSNSNDEQFFKINNSNFLINNDNLDEVINSLTTFPDTYSSVDQALTRHQILLDIREVITNSVLIEKAEILRQISTTHLMDIAKDEQAYIKELELLLKLIASSHKQESKESKKNEPIDRALMYIEKNYQNPDISLSSVAEQVSLSAAHFSTIFSQTMQLPFIEYLTNKRIEKAKELLRNTSDKLSTITFDIGYNDPNYFSFLFKKKVGISPSHYRNKKTQNSNK